jgi:glycosyltransferase involved in cell wall biosynthesis
MKITFLLTWADSMGGTERAMFTQAEYLAETHDVEVLSVFRTNDKPFFDIDPRITVRYLIDNTGSVQRPIAGGLSDEQCQSLSAQESQLVRSRWESAFNRLTDVEIERALREIDCDVLVSSSPSLMAMATTLAPPRVVTVHEEHRPTQMRAASAEPIFRYAPRLDALVVLTERTRSWLADTLGESAPRLEIIVNGIPKGFRPKSSATSKLITIAGRCVPNKQVDHAVRAFAQVADEFPDWALRVLGEGPELPAVRRLAEGLDIIDRVQFIGRTSDMPEEWAKASIALLSSRDGEALPLVLIEAFAAGVPAVAYDCATGPAEIITPGVNGLLAGQDDIDGLAGALRTLMGDETKRREFGAAALAASADYDLDAVMAQWESLFSELVAERDDPARTHRKSGRLAAWLARTGGSGFAPTAPKPAGPLRTVDATEIEAAVAAADAGLVRSGGWLASVSDRLTPAQIVQANLDLVVDALEAAGIDYQWVRDKGVRHRVVVTPADRLAVLAAFVGAFKSMPVYVEAHRTAGVVIDTTVAGALGSPDHAQAAMLRVFRPSVTSNRLLRYGAAYGCDVEFWPTSEDGSEFVPGHRTDFGKAIPAGAMTAGSVTFHGRTYKAAAGLDVKFVNDIDFPIDAVYTWVDRDDPSWIERKNALITSRGGAPVPAADSDARIRGRDELRYSLRSLDMFAPWIRRIFIVTDDQVPNWLDTSNPRIQMVSHKELFGSRGALPTFNSHAIESQLHHINGLSEHFLYLSDDIFFGRPASPDQYFASNGHSMFFRSSAPIPMTPAGPDDDANIAAAKNGRDIIARMFGRTALKTYGRTPHSLRVSVLSEMSQALSEDFARNAASQLRSAEDVAIPSWLHHEYAYLTGRAAPGSILANYVDLDDPNDHPKLSRILFERGIDVFSLHDTQRGRTSEYEAGLVLRGFLESYFPIRSQFERE